MTVAYNSLQDVYDLGLTAPAFVTVPRVLNGRQGDSLAFATGVFTQVAHGLAAGDVVRLILVAQGGSLPGGASSSTIYYVNPINYWQFTLSTSTSGGPVTFTDAGTTQAAGASAWGVLLDPERRLTRISLMVGGDLDQDLTAHITPIQPDPITGLFPLKLVAIAARMVARRATTGIEYENPAFKAAKERIYAEEKRDDEQRAAWRLGQPLYPTPNDQTGGAVPQDSMRANNRYTTGLYANGFVRGTPTPDWSRRTI